jgi:hypothetical protein
MKLDYTNLQHTNKQHTVPKCYLKNFSDAGTHIYTKSKTNHVNDEKLKQELKMPKSLKQVTVFDNFYTVKSGSQPMAVETIFYANYIEKPYPELYKLLIDSERKIISMDERKNLLTFFLSLHLRTPRQFNTFFNSIPSEHRHEMEVIKEDYKAAHLAKVLPHFIAAHEYKQFRVMRIKDNYKFFTSDNPVMIIDKNGNIKSLQYAEWFNRENRIVVPLDTMHCLVMLNTMSSDGIDLDGKIYVNLIDRIDVDVSRAQSVNMMTLGNADKYFFGSKDFITSFFSVFKLRIKGA